jgi:hypothetical protein
MRYFRGGLTLSVHKIPFRVFSSNSKLLSGCEQYQSRITSLGECLLKHLAQGSENILHNGLKPMRVEPS